MAATMRVGGQVIRLVIVVTVLAGCGGDTDPAGEGESCSRDIDCAGTLQCIAGTCLHPHCPDRRCPPGWACVQGSCTSPDCFDTECDPGEACADGACYPEDCPSRPCPGLGEVCVDEECLPSSCVGVTCPEGQTCANGLCYPSDCETQECDGYGEVCIEEECVQRSCVGVTCPPAQSCANGYCYPSDCQEPCPDGWVCEDGVCVDAACVGVTCPDGQACAYGDCWPENCPDQTCGENQVCYDGHCVEVECVGDRCCPPFACTLELECKLIDCPDGGYWCGVQGDEPAWTQEAPACDDDDPCTRDDTCRVTSVCAGDPIVCDDPPADSCLDATTLRSYEATGTCSDGSCQYTHEDMTCPFGCEAGACQACQPDCSAQECGPDPVCGESCGTCQPGEFCTVDYQCHTPGFTLVEIPAGSFSMGSPESEPGRDEYTGSPEGAMEETLHVVTLTRAFLMSDTEVTQGDFVAMLGYNPSHFASCGPDCPVENLSWHEAAAFCNQLSVGSGLQPCFACSGSGDNIRCQLADAFATPYDCPGYRLPTEAEWEYAARAGTQTAIHSGPLQNTGCTPLDPNLDVIGWYLGNARATYADAVDWDCEGERLSTGPQPVGGKWPNDFDLYDMSGNVWEWVMECVYDYADTFEEDPLGPLCLYDNHIFRGGGMGNHAAYCRSGERAEWPGYGDRGVDIGFRPVRTLPP